MCSVSMNSDVYSNTIFAYIVCASSLRQGPIQIFSKGVEEFVGSHTMALPMSVLLKKELIWFQTYPGLSRELIKVPVNFDSQENTVAG